MLFNLPRNIIQSLVDYYSRAAGLLNLFVCLFIFQPVTHHYIKAKHLDWSSNTLEGNLFLSPIEK